ncbi:alpha/beta hydrolase fold domain-containing protein [Saccharothrix syringae]|uniref:Alpha/beta hydrolase fold-3 domain-containing protein n=1 Tax=Saccharothrix syringae TaxID=103733 RepID=A0A5Q0GR88_SACSY|nr:alpha/beta hydrolase fold domain-containing protein [Saccharothrix syringae]QFZ16458.1 hypothetical protein EKG83_02365 [Saccharothrix syringae]
MNPVCPRCGWCRGAPQTVEVYRWLLGASIGSARVAFAGDSAGAALVVNAQPRAREPGLPPPAAALLISPWVDPEAGGGTYRTNAETDGYFYRDLVALMAGLYPGPGGDPRDPTANPPHADLTGLAPMYVRAGGHETLLDDGRALVERAGEAGLDVFDGQVHTFRMAAGRSPEADDAIRRLAGWVRPGLGLA